MCVFEAFTPKYLKAESFNACNLFSKGCKTETKQVQLRMCIGRGRNTKAASADKCYT